MEDKYLELCYYQYTQDEYNFTRVLSTMKSFDKEKLNKCLKSISKKKVAFLLDRGVYPEVSTSMFKDMSRLLTKYENYLQIPKDLLELKEDKLSFTNCVFGSLLNIIKTYYEDYAYDIAVLVSRSKANWVQEFELTLDDIFDNKLEFSLHKYLT